MKRLKFLMLSSILLLLFLGAGIGIVYLWPVEPKPSVKVEGRHPELYLESMPNYVKVYEDIHLVSIKQSLSAIPRKAPESDCNLEVSSRGFQDPCTGLEYAFDGSARNRDADHLPVWPVHINESKHQLEFIIPGESPEVVCCKYLPREYLKLVSIPEQPQG